VLRTSQGLRTRNDAQRPASSRGRKGCPRRPADRDHAEKNGSSDRRQDLEKDQYAYGFELADRRIRQPVQGHIDPTQVVRVASQKAVSWRRFDKPQKSSMVRRSARKKNGAAPGMLRVAAAWADGWEGLLKFPHRSKPQIGTAGSNAGPSISLLAR